MKNIEAARRSYRNLLRANESALYDVGEFGMRMRMFRVGNIDIEAMEPTGGGGVIAKFLERSGEGIHHIAFEVDDILGAVRRMKEYGVDIIDENPFPIEGLKAVFLQPRCTGGALIEFIEGDPIWIDGGILPVSPQVPPPGAGLAVEGIVEVGISAKDPEETATLYSTILSCGDSEGTGGVVTVGNVGLRISGVPPGGRPGLHHVTFKVADLDEATLFLEANAIRFVAIMPADARRPREVAMECDAFAGLRVHLVEDAPPRAAPG